jgi:hypothetical protein
VEVLLYHEVLPGGAWPAVHSNTPVVPLKDVRASPFVSRDKSSITIPFLIFFPCFLVQTSCQLQVATCHLASTGNSMVSMTSGYHDITVSPSPQLTKTPLITVHKDPTNPPAFSVEMASAALADNNHKACHCSHAVDDWVLVNVDEALWHCYKMRSSTDTTSTNYSANRRSLLQAILWHIRTLSHSPTHVSSMGHRIQHFRVPWNLPWFSRGTVTLPGQTPPDMLM